jgi:2-dehydropantoate 2-reductase
MEEVRAVAIAHGVLLSEDLVERLLTWTDTAAGAMKTSTRQDLEAGKRLEVEALNGAVVRKGEAAGVPTPFNFALYALLKSIDPAS